MANRLQLSKELKKIVPNVYFQPPASLRISYPCIVYKLASIGTEFADNGLYLKNKMYELTLIHTDPDNLIVEKLLEFPLCSLDRTYVSDNLYHYIYTIYY